MTQPTYGPQHYRVPELLDFALQDGLNGLLTQGRRLLLESMTRRIRTRRGALFYDLDYGCSLLDFLGEGFIDRGAELAAVLEVELEDDPRVSRASVTVQSVSLSGISLTVALETPEGLLLLGVNAAGAPNALTPTIEVIDLGSQ